jgi:mannose-1-phosphate guanylyltransferase/mannose-6-phosphate isomerase
LLKEPLIICNHEHHFRHSTAQEVKKIVAQLKDKQRSECKLHQIVHRPWGTYETINSGEKFHVKRLSVKSHARLSLQSHHHRAEH